jgi:hypothetical protein
MPRVSIRTGFIGPDDKEEILSDYLCDCPDCPNSAEHLVGVARELGGGFVVCAEHAAVLQRRARGGQANEKQA